MIDDNTEMMSEFDEYGNKNLENGFRNWPSTSTQMTLVSLKAMNLKN